MEGKLLLLQFVWAFFFLFQTILTYLYPPACVADSDRFWWGWASEDEYNASGDHCPAAFQNTSLYRGGVLVSLTECIFPSSPTAQLFHFILLSWLGIPLRTYAIELLNLTYLPWHYDWWVGQCIIQTLVISEQLALLIWNWGCDLRKKDALDFPFMSWLLWRQALFFSK